ncbi:MAG: Mitochondrial fission protein [Vezdaea aestivalis]|nr:MAG: Mitochondrial fission protein [Vezdaea aestivalis]
MTTPPGAGDPSPSDNSVLGTSLTARNIEAFGRKVSSTATHLITPLADAATGSTSLVGSTSHYQAAMTELHRELRRPGLQQRVFSFATTSPTDIVRARLSTREIQHRAVSRLSDQILREAPVVEHAYSLFQGFEATVSEGGEGGARKRRSRGQKLIAGREGEIEEGVGTREGLRRERKGMGHQLEMLAVRKNMASSEIREIDNKIANLARMRKIVLERLAGFENEAAVLDHDLLNIDNKLEDMGDEVEEAEPPSTPPIANSDGVDSDRDDVDGMNASFMSKSIFEKLPSPRSKRLKAVRRQSMPVLHEHIEPGSNIREIQAHNDQITTMDFDVPFGLMVSAAMDDTVRVWDLSVGRCIGMLEGHQASVRCLQVEDNIVATGSMDASIRLWDLSKAAYDPQDNRINKDAAEDEEDGLGFGNPEDEPPGPPESSMQDCPLFSLEAHVDEVTALYFRGNLLVSGSSDKTLRQWDLETGRCVQTLDVLWAAAQASSTMGSGDGQWRATGRLPDGSADFVGALQCFDAALACGTADGMVRLWDLRSGQVHRSLVGHTGPVTCLQFDDQHLVTGSLDRSIRIWDLRTGSISDAYAYDQQISSMAFDTRRIVAAAGEDVVKVYDKLEGKHWDCGAGIAAAEEGRSAPAVVERVRLRDGYLVEGRRDGMIGIWAC